jgi:excisionase family DNA binding protein
MATNFAVHIEFDRRVITPEGSARMVDELTEWHAAVGTSPRGWVDVQMTVPAETLEGAVRTALAVTSRVVGAQPLTVEALPDAEFDARLGVVPVPELIGVSDAASVLQVSRQRVQQMITEGKLSAVSIGRSLVLTRSEVEAMAARAS